MAAQPGAVIGPHYAASKIGAIGLGNATSTVLVHAYSFTSAPIAKALVEAHRRGLNMQVVLDKSQRTEK